MVAGPQIVVNSDLLFGCRREPSLSDCLAIEEDVEVSKRIVLFTTVHKWKKVVSI